MVVVKCARCGAHDATWTFDRPLFGYYALCDQCHICVKHLLTSIDDQLRLLPEKQAMMVLGFVVRQHQLQWDS